MKLSRPSRPRYADIVAPLALFPQWAAPRMR